MLRGVGEQITYYRRYHGYDYSRGASLFVTVATEPRKALFGLVENAAVVLSDLGRLVLESMRAIPRYNPLKYELMYNQPEYMRIREPIDSTLIPDFPCRVENAGLPVGAVR